MIIVNGNEQNFRKGTSVEEWLKGQNLNLSLIAVEYNGDILSRALYSSTFLKNGDILEIVTFVGGG